MAKVHQRTDGGTDLPWQYRTFARKKVIGMLSIFATSNNMHLIF